MKAAKETMEIIKDENEVIIVRAKIELLKHEGASLLDYFNMSMSILINIQCWPKVCCILFALLLPENLVNFQNQGQI